MKVVVVRTEEVEEAEVMGEEEKVEELAAARGVGVKGEEMEEEMEEVAKVEEKVDGYIHLTYNRTDSESHYLACKISVSEELA